MHLFYQHTQSQFILRIINTIQFSVFSRNNGFTIHITFPFTQHKTAKYLFPDQVLNRYCIFLKYCVGISF